ncbi:TetR/AcrR family transcriptional regulator C-terminal domain-containing protein [Paraburkholderia sp. BL10I2N1]|uniref:TetR/AcrR family transcriptional regulator C-terminal domain-containing protein n=1 Tax=Paraburkholderia sp. BL10I2N1 TaxID=1938796 RepID=UPI00105C54AB|nr:TetR/AcrR family transcriptional regulator C-terminal domain-containing protein [Paraburkholderia sp. BL10I2N1]
MRRGIEAIGSSGKRSLTAKLREAGVHMLRVWLSARTLVLLRTLIAEVDRFEDLARAAHPAENEQLVQAITQMLDAGVEEGEIACRHTDRAAVLFMSLVGSDLTMKALLDPHKTMPSEDFETHAK